MLCNTATRLTLPISCPFTNPVFKLADDSDSSSAAGGRGQAAGTAMPSGAFAIHLASRSVCPSSGVSGTHASLATATPTRPLSVAVSWQETRPRSPSLGCDSEAFVSVRPHIAIDEQGRSRAATLVVRVSTRTCVRCVAALWQHNTNNAPNTDIVFRSVTKHR